LVSVPFAKGIAYPHIWEIVDIEKAIDKGPIPVDRVVDDRIGRVIPSSVASRKTIIAMLFSFCSRSKQASWDSQSNCLEEKRTLMVVRTTFLSI
jgi:hypothetical protein